MTLNHLLAKFNEALIWNAALYMTYKILLTALSFALYATLPSDLFCAWSTINSFVYLFVLWTECGLRKSVPLFAPLMHHTTTITRFTYALIGGKSLIVLMILPLFWLALHGFFNLFEQAEMLAQFRIPIYLLFIAESSASGMEILFHARFMHKIYNSLTIVLLSITMVSSIGMVFTYADINVMLIHLITIRAACAFAITIISLTLLHYLPTDQHNQTHSESLNMRDFMAHTASMWGTTLLKSLTERNVLIPFLAITLGQHVANTVKIANDGALLFYRAILKTIGTSDTALLAYAYTSDKNYDALENALYKLIYKVITLCSIAFAIVFIVISYAYAYIIYYDIRLFFIFSVTYIAELALSPAERMLEVLRQYQLIFKGYIIYSLVVLVAGYVVWTKGCNDPLYVISSLQGVRLFTSLMFLYLFSSNTQFFTASKILR